MVHGLARAAGRRNVAGSFCRWTFILLNTLMILWAVAVLAGVRQVTASAASDLEIAGALIGGSIGMASIAMLWSVGAVLLGTLALATGGGAVPTARRSRQVAVFSDLPPLPRQRPLRPRVTDPDETRPETRRIAAPARPALRPLPGAARPPLALASG